MKASQALLAVILSGIALSATAASCQVSDYKATYDFKAGSASGTVQRTLQLMANGQYQFTSVTQAKVLFFSDTLTEVSKGTFAAGHVTPSQYSIVDTKKDQPWVVDFTDKQATLSYLGKHQVVALPLYTQDNLSYPLQLRVDLLNHQKTLSYPVIYGDDNHQAVVGTYAFNVVGSAVPLTTALGQLKTIELKRQDPQTKVVTLLWVAPTLGDLVVQSQMLKANGDVQSSSSIQQYTPGNSVYCIK